MNDPNTDAPGDAIADAIGGLFELPDVDLDNQMVEMVSGETLNNVPSEDVSTGTNANANDDGLDSALIDLIPIP